MKTIGENFHAMLEKIKAWWQQFDLQEISKRVGGSSAEAVEAALYFGVALISGFFFKKYGKIVLFVLVSLAVLLSLMEYNDMVAIRWEAIYELVGIQPPFNVSVVFKSSFIWIKQHILLTVAAALGFLVGYKLG